MNILPTLLIILSSLGGLSLATFIHLKKKEPKPLVCPIGHSCDPVVHSDYSRFMRIPVELLGILYYLIVLISYVLLFMYPQGKTPATEATLLALSAIAFLFSAYLTWVQAFVLKEWCTWCLISASLCVLIFSLSLWLSDISLLSYVL